MPVPAPLRTASEVAARALVVGLAVLLAGALLWKLRLVVLPVFIALLLATVLTPPVVALERRGWPSAVATAGVFLAFLAALAAVLTLVVPPTVDELSSTGSALQDGLDEVERWLVDGPLDLNRSTVQRYTDDPGGTLADLARSSSASLTRSVVVAGEVVAGALLSLVLTFFLVKDGRDLQRWLLDRTATDHRPLLGELAAAGWSALTGFLRGAALLGVVEAIIIGVTVWLVGAPLALPVAVFTFLGAFFPIVGAVTAGAVAVLVTLATQGFGAALIVLAVAVVVQQLDNDLLAPFIYGRSLQLHPLVVLVVLTAGGAVGGIAGAFLAVPLTGAAVGMGSVLWRRRHPEGVIDAPDDGAGPAGSRTGG